MLYLAAGLLFVGLPGACYFVARRLVRTSLDSVDLGCCSDDVESRLT